MASPTLHYSWVGPPPGQSGVAGHDIAFPKLMSEQNQSNDIVFWCLDAHREHYEKEFQDNPNIKVKSFENLLNEHILSDSPFRERAQTMQTLMADLLSPEKDWIRDRVAIKNILSVYLLMSQGGYTLDTNIQPLSGQNIELPKQDNFAMAKQRGRSRFDCFMMYANQQENQSMFEAVFDKYARGLQESQSMRELPSYYGETVASQFMTLLTESKPQPLEGDKDGFTMTFPELGLSKTYYNTHKVHNMNVPMLLAMITDNNMDGIRAYIAAGGDINAKFNRNNVIDLSPLHQAVFSQNQEAVKLLMENGANLNAVANFNQHVSGDHTLSGDLTTIDLAKALGDDKMTALLETPLKKAEPPVTEANASSGPIPLERKTVRELRDEYQSKIKQLQGERAKSEDDDKLLPSGHKPG